MFVLQKHLGNPFNHVFKKEQNSRSNYMYQSYLGIKRGEESSENIHLFPFSQCAAS